MDTIFTQLVNAGNGPTIRDGVDSATRPATRTLPVPGAAEPAPARAPRAPLSDGRRVTTGDRDDRRRTSSSTTSRPARCTSVPRPYVGTYLLLRIDDRADGRELVRRLHRIVNPARRRRTRATTRRSPWPSPTTASRRSGCRRRRWTASRRSSGRGWRPAPPCSGDVGESSPEHWEKPLGTRRCARRHRGPVPGRRPARRPSPRRRGGPTRSCRGSS